MPKTGSAGRVDVELQFDETPDRRKSRSSGGGSAVSVGSAASAGSAGSEGHEKRRRRKESGLPSTDSSSAASAISKSGIGGCLRTTKVDSPAAACAAKDPKRRVSFTDLTESSAETSASSLLDSTLLQAQAPISSRNPPSPAPSRLANGVGGANGSIQQRRLLLQQPAIPSPLTMARRLELAEDSPLVVRGAVLKH